MDHQCEADSIDVEANSSWKEHSVGAEAKVGRRRDSRLSGL